MKFKKHLENEDRGFRMRLQQHVTSASCQEVAQDGLRVLREHQLLRADSITGCVVEILLSSHSEREKRWMTSEMGSPTQMMWVPIAMIEEVTVWVP